MFRKFLNTSLGWIFVFGVFLLVGTFTFVMGPVFPKKNSSTTIPLTHIFEKKEVWKVASTFEQVDGSLSLYVAQAHRQGEHDSVNRLVFLDINSCLGEQQRIPRIGEKIKIMSIEVRASVSSNTVTREPQAVMAFVQPSCQ